MAARRTSSLAPPGRTAAHGEPPPGERPAVLLLEDELALRHLTTLLLGEEGFRVRSAADGHEALQLLGEFEPDVLLVDLIMPGMDGREFLAQARSAGVRAPAIIVSASPDAERVQEEFQCGLVPKPYEFRRLAAEIRRTLSAVPA